jgi:hypothetical protein
MLVCARCGTESPDGFRFCGACEAAPQEVAAPRRSRKVVTALFFDVTDQWRWGSKLDPEVHEDDALRAFRLPGRVRR